MYTTTLKNCVYFLFGKRTCAISNYLLYYVQFSLYVPYCLLFPDASFMFSFNHTLSVTDGVQISTSFLAPPPTQWFIACLQAVAAVGQATKCCGCDPALMDGLEISTLLLYT